jgi:hypothetical protein
MDLVARVFDVFFSLTFFSQLFFLWKDVECAVQIACLEKMKLLQLSLASMYTCV